MGCVEECRGECVVCVWRSAEVSVECEEDCRGECGGVQR